MNLSSQALTKLTPHGSGMLLIDKVLNYDADSILCQTHSHQKTNNPLISHGNLASIILVEYASQAAALHAGLNQQEFTQGKPAFVGAVKSVKLYAESISNLETMLNISARCLLSNNNGAIYAFEVESATKIAEGQIHLILPT